MLRLIAILFSIAVLAHADATAETKGFERHLLLAPGEGNPRNSEGDFIQLKDKRILFVYTHFTGGAADHAQAHLASRESFDGGKTWSTEDKVVVPNEGGMNVMSVSLLRLKSGKIGLFYLRKNSSSDCRPVVRWSTDEARSWSQPSEIITDQPGYYVLNNSRVVQLKNGRLVVPVAQHVGADAKRHDGEVCCYLSDDDGNTWRRSELLIAKEPDGKQISVMEPAVVELKDKKLFMLLRTKLGCQYTSYSIDGGESWTTPKASELFSPESPASIKRIPKTGDLLVLWNDHYDKPVEFRRARPPVRTPLTAAISRDEGKTWEKKTVLENDPDSGYCYTAIDFVGSRVLIGYCTHKSRWGLESTAVSSFDLKTLYRSR